MEERLAQPCQWRPASGELLGLTEEEIEFLMLVPEVADNPKAPGKIEQTLTAKDANNNDVHLTEAADDLPHNPSMGSMDSDVRRSLDFLIAECQPPEAPRKPCLSSASDEGTPSQPANVNDGVRNDSVANSIHATQSQQEAAPTSPPAVLLGPNLNIGIGENREQKVAQVRAEREREQEREHSHRGVLALLKPREDIQDLFELVGIDPHSSRQRSIFQKYLVWKAKHRDPLSSLQVLAALARTQLPSESIEFSVRPTLHNH